MQFSEREMRSMLVFEHAYRLKDLKTGDLLTKQQIDAIQFFLGELIREVQLIAKNTEEMKIWFDEHGKPQTSHPHLISVKIMEEQ